MITHVFVTVTEGREVPFPAGDAAAPGGAQLKAVAGKVYRVAWSGYTRRRIAAGDLQLADAQGGEVSNESEARAPELEGTSYELDDTGAVVRRPVESSPAAPDAKPVDQPADTSHSPRLERDPGAGEPNQDPPHPDMTSALPTSRRKG